MTFNVVPFLILFLLLVGAAGILALVAFLRTEQMQELRWRLDQLQRRLDEMQRQMTAAKRETEEAARPVEAEEELPAVIPVERGERREAGGEQKSWIEEVDWESWIGRRALGWVAVVLLLFAVGFFLQHAFEQGWIGQLGRVALGVAGGLVLVAAGLYYHFKKWHIFSQILTSGGVMLLFLCTYASFGYYYLIPQQGAGFFLTVLVVETMLLAVFYEAVAIAIMAVVGGLLTPLLLHSAQDQYISLFLYLLVLNSGIVGLAVWRQWPAFATLSLAGTQGLFWLWYGEHFHPEKLRAALTFEVVLFGLFLLQLGLLHGWRQKKTKIEDLVRLILNGLLFLIALHTLLHPEYHDWLGSLTLLLAVVYLALGWWLMKRLPEDTRLPLAMTSVAMGLVAVVFPLELDVHWVAFGWAVQGLVLWWFGLRVRAITLRVLGTALGALAVLRLVFINTPEAHSEPFVPIFNGYALPALAVSACAILAAMSAIRFSAQLKLFDHSIMWIAGLGGLALIWLILSVETYEYFHQQIQAEAREVASWTGHEVNVGYDSVFNEDGWGRKTFTSVEPAPALEVVDAWGRPIWEVQRERARDLARLAQTWLSIVWTVYAAVLLVIGFWRNLAAVRWAALVVFGITLFKVVTVDMADLPAIYRVATFLVLSLMMAGGAWIYHRVRAAT